MRKEDFPCSLFLVPCSLLLFVGLGLACAQEKKQREDRCPSKPFQCNSLVRSVDRVYTSRMLVVLANIDRGDKSERRTARRGSEQGEQPLGVPTIGIPSLIVTR